MSKTGGAMNDEPQTTEELLAYILRYEDTIYVRKSGEKFGAFALSSLSPEDKAREVMRFMSDGIVPLRVRGSDE